MNAAPHSGTALVASASPVPVTVERAMRWAHCKLHARPENMPQRCLSASKPLCLLLLILRLKISQASMGDADFSFRQCVSRCESSGCAVMRAPPGTPQDCSAACPQANGKAVPLDLRALQWSCRDDCRSDAVPALQPVPCALTLLTHDN